MRIQKRKRTGRLLLFLALAMTVLIIATLWCLYDSNFVLDVSEYTVELEGLPKGFDGYKIVQISDLHGAQFGENNTEIIDILRKAEPDMIAITGDIVDRAADIAMLYDAASAIASVAPTYYVPGNHEYGTRQSGEIFSILKRAGITVLRNQSVSITKDGDDIRLIGIDDPNGPADMMPMEDVVELVRSQSESFMLMLNHRYDRFGEFAELQIPFVLTGHAHGGLIRLPFTDGLIGPGRRILPKYTNGIYTMDNTTMLTSRGVGNASFSLRLFNRPHIPVITLRSL